jgi:hypothetical protein
VDPGGDGIVTNAISTVNETKRDVGRRLHVRMVTHHLIVVSRDRREDVVLYAQRSIPALTKSVPFSQQIRRQSAFNA